mgnify:CR=1 FL=1
MRTSIERRTLPYHPIRWKCLVDSISCLLVSLFCLIFSLTTTMFEHCPLLQPYLQNNSIDEIFDIFRQYKTKVPVCGAILLNPGLDKVRGSDRFSMLLMDDPNTSVSVGEGLAFSIKLGISKRKNKRERARNRMCKERGKLRFWFKIQPNSFFHKQGSGGNRLHHPSWWGYRSRFHRIHKGRTESPIVYCN